MRLFTVHFHHRIIGGDRDLVLIKEGFCWPAFFFSFLWALWHRLWLAALIVFAASLGLGSVMVFISLDQASQVAASLGLSVIVGFIANDLRRWELERRGFVSCGIVSGKGRDAAERRFLEADPEISARLR